MGDLSVEVPGLKPKNLGKVPMEGTTPQAAVQTGREFLEHCFDVNPEGVPKQVYLRIVEGAACEPDGDEGGLSVKWADVKVVRADESVEFLLDRSNPGAGHLIRLDGCYCGARPGQYAVLGGVIGEPMDETLATFSASAFCDGEIVSCSGGPVPYVALADLEATGQTAPVQFWRWRDGLSGADRAEHFVVDVPVWSWKGTDASVFDLDRESVRRALDQMELRYPDNGRRSDCAYLRVHIPLDAEGERGLVGSGFVCSPFTNGSTIRPCFHAQMVLGHSEVFGYGAGRTWDEALADLKACLMESLEDMGNRERTDPVRLAHAGVAAQIREYENSTSVTADMALKRFFHRPDVPMVDRYLLDVPDHRIYSFSNGYGRPFVARVVMPGDPCGREGCHSWGNKELGLDKPGVEFYDATRRFDPGFGPLGQFVASYYLMDLAKGEPDRGICLHGGVEEWVLSADVKRRVIEWVGDCVKRETRALSSAGFAASEEGAPDVEDLKSRIRSWDVFDYQSETMSARDFVKGLKDDFLGLREMNSEYVSNQAYEGAKSLLREEGFDPDEVRERWPDYFDELRFAVEEAARFNIGRLVPSNLFIRMDDEVEMTGMTADPEDAASERAALLVVAQKFGFDEKAVDTVIRNATYGGMAGIGVIADGETVLQAHRDGTREIQGEAILYCTDSVNGSGHYLTGKGASIQVKDVPDAIDTGAYSLGAVFRTNDWSY
jgi:hypothetical protein